MVAGLADGALGRGQGVWGIPSLGGLSGQALGSVGGPLSRGNGVQGVGQLAILGLCQWCLVLGVLGAGRL